MPTGVRFWLGEQGAEKASCGDDVVVGRFFFEIFQGVQRLGAFLHFIENDESFAGAGSFGRR